MTRSAASASTNPRRASVPRVVSIRIIVLDATERVRVGPSNAWDIRERHATEFHDVQKWGWSGHGLNRVLLPVNLL